MPTKIGLYCDALAHLSAAVQLHSGKQTAQCSWAPQDSKWGILIPLFFWHQSDLFGHKEKGKSLPPNPHPNHLKRIGKWECKLCQSRCCMLRNTTGQEMNLWQVRVLKTQRRPVNRESDTLTEIPAPPVGASHVRNEDENCLRLWRNS